MSGNMEIDKSFLPKLGKLLRLTKEQVRLLRSVEFSWKTGEIPEIRIEYLHMNIVPKPKEEETPLNPSPIAQEWKEEEKK